MNSLLVHSRIAIAAFGLALLLVTSPAWAQHGSSGGHFGGGGHSAGHGGGGHFGGHSSGHVSGSASKHSTGFASHGGFGSDFIVTVTAP